MSLQTYSSPMNEFRRSRDTAALAEYETELPVLLVSLAKLNAYVYRMIDYRRRLFVSKLDQHPDYRHLYDAAGQNLVDAGWRRAEVNGRVNGILADIPIRLDNLSRIDRRTANGFRVRLNAIVNGREG